MGTRGAVGWGNLDHYKAVYNHLDSYPKGLGQDVWGFLKKMGATDFVAALSKYTEWKDFIREGICPYCGQQGIPCNSRGQHTSRPTLR